MATQVFNEERELPDDAADERPSEEPESVGDDGEINADDPQQEDADSDDLGESSEDSADDVSDEEGHDENEVLVSIDGDEDNADDDRRAPDWIKATRERNKALNTENRTLRRKLAELESGAKAGAVQAPVVVGEKPKRPTMESVDYDSDKLDQAIEKYDRDLEAWHDRKREADAQTAEAESAQQAERDAWNKRLQGYAQAKARLSVPDYDDAESVVQDALSETQQGVLIVAAGKDAAPAIVYALSKRPNRLRELASITDPVEFAAEVGELRKTVKVERKSKAAPEPERKLRGNATGAVSRSLDQKRLDDLREKAYASGDMTAYFEAKQKYEARKRA